MRTLANHCSRVRNLGELMGKGRMLTRRLLQRKKNKTKFLPWKVPMASNRSENVGT